MKKSITIMITVMSFLLISCTTVGKVSTNIENISNSGASTPKLGTGVNTSTTTSGTTIKTEEENINTGSTIQTDSINTGSDADIDTSIIEQDQIINEDAGNEDEELGTTINSSGTNTDNTPQIEMQ